MNRFTLLIFCSSLFILNGNASIARKMVKDGEQVPVKFGNVSAIKRNVTAGEQIFHFDGTHQGTFVDSKGKEIDSSNYSIENGTLIIKKFSKADEGAYVSEPNLVFKKDSDGGMSAVPGLRIIIEIKQ
ncbi:hypothetical protein CRE_11959 [Caenorhabditis remanei]|uniref:Uncharacterized protein n=1 Tax=Caenorhabditis remanei TaxID=31234 RepID=E3M4Q1_CAERE|nr:hypothetical protein CRE_11959 [Caenorhabditis remanei]